MSGHCGCWYKSPIYPLLSEPSRESCLTCISVFDASPAFKVVQYSKSICATLKLSGTPPPPRLPSRQICFFEAGSGNCGIVFVGSSLYKRWTSVSLPLCKASLWSLILFVCKMGLRGPQDLGQFVEGLPSMQKA